MSSHDPDQPGPEQQASGPPSFDKQPPTAQPRGAPPPFPGGPSYEYGPVSEYGAPSSPIPGGPPLAGRGRRLLARVIDSILVGVVASLLTVPFVNYDTVGGGLLVTAVTQV